MNIGKNAKFEQDRTYDDLEGNVKNFTIRDYSKKIKSFPTPSKINEEGLTPTEVYNNSLYEYVDDWISENNPEHCRECFLGVVKDGGSIKWDREVLYIMYKAYMELRHYNSDWSQLERIVKESILRELTYDEETADTRNLIEDYRKNYKEINL